mgnify:FL=1
MTMRDAFLPKHANIALIPLRSVAVAGVLFVALCQHAGAQLPKGIVVERVDAALDNEDNASAPYLSLNIDGHTAAIKALAFSRNSQTLYSAGQDKVVHVWKFGGPRAKAFVVEAKGWHKSHSIRWEIARSIRG